MGAIRTTTVATNNKPKSPGDWHARTEQNLPTLCPSTWTGEDMFSKEKKVSHPLRIMTFVKTLELTASSTAVDEAEMHSSTDFHMDLRIGFGSYTSKAFKEAANSSRPKATPDDERCTVEGQSHMRNTGGRATFQGTNKQNWIGPWQQRRSS